MNLDEKRRIKQFERFYVAGQFQGKYYGKFNGTDGSYRRTDYDIHIYEGTLIQTCPATEDQFIEIGRQSEYYPLSGLGELLIEGVPSPTSNQAFFCAHLEEVRISRVRLIETQKVGARTFGTLTGYAVALVQENVTYEDVPEPEETDQPVQSKAPSSVSAAPPKPLSLREVVREIANVFPLLLGLVFFALFLISIIQSLTIYGWITLGVIALTGVLIWLVPFVIRWLFLPVTWLFGFLGARSGLIGIGWLLSICLLVYYGEAGYYDLATLSGLFFLVLSVSFFGGVLRLLGHVFVGLSLVLGILTAGVLIHDAPHSSSPAIVPQEREATTSGTTTVTPHPDRPLSPLYITHRLRWMDYNQREYEGTLQIYTLDYLRSASRRTNFQLLSDDQQEFTRLLSSIVMDGQKELPFLFRMIDSINTVKNLDRSELAEVIVSFVQDIPYVMLQPGPCQVSVPPCVGPVLYGIHTPLEFLYTLQGDCDTRALLLYLVLKRYGYDVILLGSLYYQHALIGINLSTTGVYYPFRGRRYYVWETTSSGWQVGQIPPNCRDLRLWEVLLANEQVTLTF